MKLFKTHLFFYNDFYNESYGKNYHKIINWLVIPFRVFFICGLLAFSLFSYAEEAEKINVIGSRIKRTQVEGPSPILVIDKDQIEKSGHYSVGDLLRDFPDITATREDALEALSATIRVGLQRGGALILINGQRMVPIPGVQVADVSQIPLLVVERIEILKDGASAIYGAEADGGVINIITKQGEKGWEVQVQASLAQRTEGNSLTSFLSFFDFNDWNNEKESWSGKGDRFNVSASYGGDVKDINYLVGGQLKLYTPLYYRDRSFAIPSMIQQFSPSGSPGSWSADDGKTWNPAPGCPEQNIHRGICWFDYSPYMQLTPQILQFSSFLQADKSVGDMTLNWQTVYSLTRSYSVLAPPPDQFSSIFFPGDPSYRANEDYRIPALVAQQKLGLPVSTPVTINYRLVEEGGPREGYLWSNFLQTQLNVVKPVWNTWEFEGNFNIGGVYYTQTSYNYFNKEKLFNMVKAGSFNPLALSGQKSDLSSAKFSPEFNMFSGLINVEPLLRGELLEVRGTPISMAIGTIGAWQTYSKDGDSVSKSGKQWGGGVLSSGQASRLFGGLYLELSSLIANQLDLQLATRSDYYNDFGFAWQTLEIVSDSEIALPFSPKLSMTFKPTDSIMFRSSYGLGFKAPSLPAMHQEGEVVGHPFVRDYLLCPEVKGVEVDKTKPGCTKQQYRTVVKGGNKELLPEYSRSFNLGVVFEPVKEFSLNMDWYYGANYEPVGIVDLGELTKIEKKHGTERVRKYGADIIRYPDGRIKQITASYINLGRDKRTGIELGSLLKVSLPKTWNLDVKLEHLHLIYEESQETPDSEIQTSVPYYEWLQNLFGLENGEAERNSNLVDYENPRWRNRMTFSFSNQNLGQEWNFILHNIPSQLEKHDATEDSVIDYYWQLDVNASFSLSQNSQLIAGVQNILGFKRPENIEHAPSVSRDIYSLMGRTIDVRYIYNF